MVRTTSDMEVHPHSPEVPSGQAVGMGMGMGTGAGVQKAFLAWLKTHKEPILLDA